MQLTLDQKVVQDALVVKGRHGDGRVAGRQRIGAGLIGAGLVLDATDASLGPNANVVP